MVVVENREEPAVSVTAACTAVGLSRATLYRERRPVAPMVTVRQRVRSPRRLSDDERQAILDVMHTPEFVDQPPLEVFATLLSRSVYLASIRTFYRVLAASGESKERRNQRLPHRHVKPSLTATAPNQVWTWDITKLATLQKGVFLHAYVIIDLFSRYVVGWMVADKECKHLAARLFAETVARHSIEPGLTVHADRGAAMKSDTLAQLLATLGASRSFSRPHVSDDNAFSEAQFKTLKYRHDYPGYFSSNLHARGWLGDFFGWHNGEHHHSGLALFTPADVFFGRVAAVHAVWQVALDAQYALYPHRFPNGPPRAALPPAAVHINPLEAITVSVDQGGVSDAESPAPGSVNSPPVDDLPPASRSQMAPRATASTPRHETPRPAAAGSAPGTRSQMAPRATASTPRHETPQSATAAFPS
jgi:putative transposase